MTQTHRAFILGLDGVPWDLIERWSDAGHLPTFARLRSEGATGPFQSTTPATTPVAWPSIATGVQADKHGIYGFQRLSRDYRQRMYTSSDFKQPCLWDILTPAVVANVPMTYPPAEIDGTVVTGMMTPSIDDQFTYPPEFRETLLEAIPDYRISLQWDEYADRKEAFIEELDRLVDSRRRLMSLLLDTAPDWRLFFFVYTAPDRLQHLFWDEAVLLEHYQVLDDILADAMEAAEEAGASLFVVSDHGFGPTSKFVYVNRLLADAGYLTERIPTTGIYGFLSKLGLRRSAVQRLLERIGLDDTRLLSLLPRRVVDSVATKIPGDHALYDVDFSRTTAFVHDSGALYVNDTERFEDGVVDPEHIPEIKAALVKLFESVRDTNGEPALEIGDGEILFPTDPDAPDLIVNGTPLYQTRNSLADSVFGDPGGTAAGHLHEGIFLAWGPDIAAGTTPDAATVYDLVPTVLQTVGEPIPANTDGRVLTEIFEQESVSATTPIERKEYVPKPKADGPAGANFEDVEDRLRGLGYLS